MVPRAQIAVPGGDHTVRGAFKDWDAIDPLLKEGAVVLLHDSTPGERNGWHGPRALLDQLNSGGRAGDYQWVNLPTADGFGLAVAQKLTARSRKWRPSLASLAAQWLRFRIGPGNKR